MWAQSCLFISVAVLWEISGMWILVSSVSVSPDLALSALEVCNWTLLHHLDIFLCSSESFGCWVLGTSCTGCPSCSAGHWARYPGSFDLRYLEWPVHDTMPVLCSVMASIGLLLAMSWGKWLLFCDSVCHILARLLMWTCLNSLSSTCTTCLMQEFPKVFGFGTNALCFFVFLTCLNERR